MSGDREKIRERIRQLLGRTTARGCTEAEAMEAAAKAAELMSAHGLAEGDIAFEEKASRAAGAATVRGPLWNTIAVCTATSAIVLTREGVQHVAFIGKAPGPEIAVYLREICDRAIDRERAVFRQGPFYRRRLPAATKKASVEDFTNAMVIRLGRRLLRMFASSMETGEVHHRAAAAERKRRYPDTTSIRQPERKTRYDEAASAGYAAGNRPQLAHGVGGTGSAPLQIGRD